MHHISERYDGEVDERRAFSAKLQQYISDLQRGTGVYLQLAQQANIRSDAQPGDLADSLAANFR